MRQSPLALSNLTGAITRLLLETVPHRFSDELGRAAPSPAPRHVKRAIDFMHANISRPISLEDIAAACHFGVRSLKKGFRDFRMTTPMAYLQHLRIEAAHQELEQASPGLTVTAIALKCGFGHMGRFAAEYKLRFGQSPSQTLLR
ncbi:helix-turn-helix transcriptional regulator [Rhizobium leguminosarum]